MGDDTTALDSVLKADVWRDHLLREETLLNAKLAELEREGDDKRFEDAREEAATRLAEVHARLSDMDAESGPSRAAALLAGELSGKMANGLTCRETIVLQVSASPKLIRRNRPNRFQEVGGVYHRTVGQ